MSSSSAAYSAHFDASSLYSSCGELVVSFADGSQESPRGGDLFYWPPGHTVKVLQDADVILFSPQDEHTHVMDHMKKAMGL